MYIFTPYMKLFLILVVIVVIYFFFGNITRNKSQNGEPESK